MTSRAPDPDSPCPRCGHPLIQHGAGCTHGWADHGPVCYCPNNALGLADVDCEHVGCGATAVAVDRVGTFLCPGHGGNRPGCTPFEEVTSWESSNG